MNCDNKQMNKDKIILYILAIAACIIAALYFSTGIFSIGISLSIVSIIGFITGLIKHDKSIRAVSLAIFIVTFLGGVVFFTLLINSNM